MWMLKRKAKGQSTVEYILLVTAVVAVMILFATGSNSSLQKKLSNGLETVSDNINSLSETLADSHSGGDGSSGNPQLSVNALSGF